MKQRFTVREKIRILREADSGLTVAELCRKHNISEQTSYNWRRKHGNMDVEDSINFSTYGGRLFDGKSINENPSSP